MKVLIAGGAGFLGSYLAERFVADGHDVHILDNFASGLRENIVDIGERITLLENDVTSFRTDQRYDIVMNFASRASRVEWEKHPVDVALSNAIGSKNLIEVALRCNALYIYASSSEVYGDPKTIPTPEDYIGCVNTTGSRSPYDEGKRFGDAITKAYERQYGLRNIIIRFFNTYGPRMRGGDFYGRVVDRFIQQAMHNEPITVYGDGLQTRSFTYVSDTIDGVMAAITKGKEGEVYNIGHDSETTIVELARLVKRLAKSYSEIHFKDLPENDPRRRAADITKMRKLGWQPMISLEEGITNTIKSKLKE
ncbi:MAG: NAD-dependent epimerase/dehydratase family protein [Candidatus Thermoplasmatota archaeon]|nr:NAD-dependent epimerase/dehydratase family protein [Candidatus Thermoplasmatota archaeon]